MTIVDAYIVMLRKWTLLILILTFCFVSNLNAAEVAASAPSEPSVAPKSTHSSILQKDGGLHQAIDWDEAGSPLVKGDPAEHISVVGAMTQMFLGLMFVIMIMLLAAWGYRKWGRRFVQSQSPLRHMEVLETISLGVKRQVSLLRVGDQVLVIGQGEHELQALSSMPYNNFQAQSKLALQGDEPSSADVLSAEEFSRQHSAEKKEHDKANNVQAFKQKLEAVLQQKT